MNTDSTLLTLRDIVAPGPVERGLYAVDRGGDTASRVLDRIVDLLWWDSVATPGVMPARVSDWAAPARPRPVVARHHRRHSRIGSIHWIDTGKAYSAETVSSQARLRGMDPSRVARSIHVHRPAGARQFLAALERVPNAALCALGENDRASLPTVFGRGTPAGMDVRPPSSVWWTPLVVISDLFSDIDDRLLPFSDRDETSWRIFERLQHLRERAVVVAMVGDKPVDRTFGQQVLHMATRVAADRGELGSRFRYAGTPAGAHH